MSVSSWFGTRSRALFLAALAVVGITPMALPQSKILEKTIRIEMDGSYLGIEMDDVTAENMTSYKLSNERGVIVKAVQKGSPAETASLQQKDVILEYGGMPVYSAAQFARLVRETPVGRKVELTVSREGKKLSLSAKVGKREGGPELSRGRVEVMPGENSDEQFDFRVPGPDRFNFRMPDGGRHPFAMPRGGFMYSNEKPRLGVTLQPLTDQMAGFLGVAGKKGAMVASVTEGSPAAGKLKAGDVIIKADEKSIAEPEDLMRLLREKGKDAKVALTIVRDKKEVSLTIELSSDDSDARKGGFKL